MDNVWRNSWALPKQEEGSWVGVDLKPEKLEGLSELAGGQLLPTEGKNKTTHNLSYPWWR